MSELLNYNEIAMAVADALVTDDHAALLDALHARYPSAKIRLISEREGRSWQPGIIDREGNRVAESLVAWIDQELAAAGGDAREVWRRHKDSGLVRTEYQGSMLYFTAPYGTDPDAFYQIEVLVGAETTCSLLFDPDVSLSFAPEDRGDLISGPTFIFSPDEKKTLSNPGYQFVELVNVRRFLRDLVEADKAEKLSQLPEMERKLIHIKRVDCCEMIGPGTFQTEEKEEVTPFLEMFPNWLTSLPSAARFFQDWAESSAGKEGHKLCDHWLVQNNIWTAENGLKKYYFCPQWADADGGLDLPEISPDWDASPYGVMESLSEFDRQAGYPFAWFYYLVHGNRITSSAGSVVAKAILAGKMHPLPECDERVLLRWYEHQYGF